MQPPGWEDLAEIVAFVLGAVGARPEAAAALADHLVDAELGGRESHGLRLLPGYVEALATGDVDAHAEPRATGDGPSVTVDGGGGFAAPAGDYAVRIGTDRSRQFGCSTVAVRNVHHLGRNGRWAEAAARVGIVSLHFGHGFRSRPQVAPFGGTAAVLGANPIALGLPSATGAIVLDMSTAETSANAVRLAAERGRPLPTKSLVRPDGTKTDDPRLFLEDGAAIAAFGGHKGSGLSLFTEILAGAIAADGWTQVGHDALFSIYVDPWRHCDEATYSMFVNELVDRLRRSPAGDQGRVVMLPGDSTATARAKALSGARPLDDSAWRSLIRAAEMANVTASLATRWPRHFEP